MAPAYDTGNCLFYDKDFIPVNSDLLNIRVNSFCKKETDMLTYVKNKECIDLSKLDGFPEEVKTLCKLRSNGMPVPLLRNGYSIFNGTKYR